MKSIDQLKSERDALDLQIQQAINLERGQAIAKAKELIATFSLTVRDLGLHTTTAVKKAKEGGFLFAADNSGEFASSTSKLAPASLTKA